MLLVGNDIVDLEQASRNKAGDARFVERVFTEQEQTLIQEAPNPTQALWGLWAAKETAYKIISKITEPPVFSHRKFLVTVKKSASLDHAETDFVVTFAGEIISVHAKVSGKYIHAIGTFEQKKNDSDCELFKQIKKIGPDDFALVPNLSFSEAEHRSIRNTESALIRHYCKQSIAQKFRVIPERIQILRPTKDGKMQPPFVLLDNERVDEVDISFSHHGQWLAWVVAVARDK